MLQAVLLFIFIAINHTIAQDPLVQLPNGLIRGRQGATFRNKVYYAFEKIPYATPPVGELRFKAPVPPSNWEGTLDTLHADVSCYQLSGTSVTESEDCLYMNVFTPQLPDGENNVSLPVMLYIHGGGFVDGTGMNTYGDLLVENDVIFVAINYRLGPFGFLSTQDEVIPGNNGLKDQLLAIKWAHDNINLFGGNPEMITIFGQSAGSASCAYQLLNQESKGLFSGAILQSGSFLSPWAFQRKSREIAFDTAAIINSDFKDNRDSQALLEFLLTVDAEVLRTTAKQYETSAYTVEDAEILQGFFYAPVVEVENPDAFLTENMYGLLQAGSLVAVPILIGMTSEEAIAFTDDAGLRWNMQSYDQNLGWLVPHDMQVADENKRTEIGTSIREIYTGGEPLLEHLGDGVRYSSDTGFTRSIIKHAEVYSKLADTYFYQFSYNGKLGASNVHYEGAESVGHSADTYYVFCGGSSCDLSGYPESDQITQERVISIWTNFAKYRNPTPEPSELLQGITWPLLSTNNGDFLYVNINETLEIKNHPKENTYSKWVALYDSLSFSDFDTY